MRRREEHAVPDRSIAGAGPSRLRRLARATCGAAACLLLLVAVPVIPLHADDSTTGQQRALLDLIVNGVSRGEAFVLVRGAELWVEVDALIRADLHGFAGDRERYDGREFVRLGSLAPRIRFTFDDVALAVRLTVDPTLLSRQDVELRADRPRDIQYRRDTSAFVNYGVNWASGSSRSVSLESGLTLGPALVTSYVTTGGTFGTLRGPTSVTFDSRQRLQRWIVGDTVAATGTLGGAVPLAGLTVSRDYDLDPYLVRYPTVGLSGALTAPASVDIYINDRLVRTEQLGPGTFTLNDLPVPAGAGSARVVMRDAFGREQEIGGAYYVTTSLLARGLQQYQYSVGVERIDATSRNWDYGGGPALLATHRIGVTDDLTLGGRVEAGHSVVSGGPQGVVRLARFGELEGSAAFSHGPDGVGEAVSGAYQYLGRWVSASAAVRRATRTYRTLSTLFDPRGTIALDAGASVSTRLGSLATVSGTWQRQRYYGSLPSTDSVSVSNTIRLTGRSELFATLSRTRMEARTSLGAFAGVSVAVGRRTTAGTSLEHSDGRTFAAADVHRSLPIGEGIGYRVRGEAGSSSLMDADFEYQSGFGRYQVRQTHVDGSTVTTFNAAGSIVAIGGSVFAARPVEQSFALVRVPGVSNVRAFVSNQEIGRTDSRGNVLVPSLLPYYGNKLSIADTDVPIELSLATPEMILAPPYRGGAVARFDVVRHQRVAGRVVVNDHGAMVTPAFGTMRVTVNGGQVESPIGGAGEFYFENLPPASYAAVIEHESGSCTFTLVVPASSRPVTQIGIVQCLAQ